MTEKSAPLKLRNPTEYHLLATQGQGYPNMTQGNFLLNHHHRDTLEDQNMDLGNCFTQQFQSPSTSSPPLQDFDDMDSLSGGRPLSSMFINPALTQSNSVPDQSLYFAPSPLNNSNMRTEDFEESPSDYSDLISNYSPVSHQRNSFMMDLNRTTGRNGEAAHSINSRMAHSLEHPSFSAPAHVGYGFNTGHMNMAAVTLFQQMENNYGINAVGARSFEEYSSMQLTQQEIAEKKRRRRESHNAVERRRRENINERIQELGTMLPEAMLEELTNPNATNGNNKPNKGAILRKSVDYIRDLEQEIINYKQRVKEMEKELNLLQVSN